MKYNFFLYWGLVWEHLVESLKVIVVSCTVLTIGGAVLISVYKEWRHDVCNYTSVHTDDNPFMKKETTENHISEEEKQLYLMTTFNTFVNKIMPEEIWDYVKATYDKIYGHESAKYYPKLKAINGNSVKYAERKYRKVAFAKENEEKEFYI